MMFEMLRKYFAKYIWLISIILVFFTGCISRIDKNIPQVGNQLVIEGQITNGNGPYPVKIGRTSDKQRIMVPVGGAQVMIFDDTDQKQELYTEKNTGYYQAAGNTVKGIPGHTYHIKVTLKDGSVYESRPETMPDIVTHDSAYFKIGTQNRINKYGITLHDHVVKVYDDTYLPQTAQPYYLEWYVREVYILQQFTYSGPLAPPPEYCFITAYPDPQTISLYDGAQADGKEIKNQLVATKVVDYSFFYRHYFNVHVVALTHNAYVYWKHVNDIINTSGTIFDVPPSTAIGNIYNVNNSKDDILGYFEAVSADTTRCSTYRNYFKFNIPEPCPEPDSHLGCAVCMDNPNGTLTQPYYFK